MCVILFGSVYDGIKDSKKPCTVFNPKLESPPTRAPKRMQGQPGQTIVIQTGHAEQPGPRVYQNYNGKTSVVLGWVLIGIGLLLVALNIAGLILHAIITNIGHGIWGGILVSLLSYNVRLNV